MHEALCDGLITQVDYDEYRRAEAEEVGGRGRVVNRGVGVGFALSLPFLSAVRSS